MKSFTESHPSSVKGSATSPDTPELSFWHRFGSYTGLIPFFGLSLMTIAGFSFAPAALISYAALIFSFLAGIIWFASLKHPEQVHITLISLAAMLWSWCWILFPNIDWSGAAALSFALLWLYERKTLSDDYGDQFMTLRQWLSSGAALSLILAFTLG